MPRARVSFLLKGVKDMKRFLACAALACLFAAPAAAQGGAGATAARRPAPAADEISGAGAERLLKSSSNAERAWGAYLAGRLGMRQHAPLLVGLLEDPALSGGGWEEGFVRRAVLDALIQLNAEVPAELLAPYEQSSRAEVIILLSRSPRANAAALLSLFVEEVPGAHWQAVGNLLAEARAVGFAARLLRHLKVKANVSVYDADGPHDIFGGGGGGCGGGCGGEPMKPEGFPPAFYYTLVEEAVRDAVVFAPGPRPVYYLRTLTSDPCGIHGCSLLEREQLRVEYVAQLLDTTDDGLEFDERPWREVVCRDEAGCRGALAGVRDEIAASHAALLARLVAAGLLDASDAADLKPDITLEVADYRARKTFPLPSELKGVTFNLCGADRAPDEGGEPADDAQGEAGPP